MFNTRGFLQIFILFLIGSSFSQRPIAAEDIPDRDITQAVEKELRANATTPAYLIDVETIDGIVSLTGTVNYIREKDRAKVVAAMVKGVRAVINRIQVDPPFRTDDNLESAVKDQLLKDPVTDSYELYVESENGVITLAGTVQSYQEKDLAEYVVSGVRGVREIENNINVNYETERNDLEIEEDILKTLRNDIRIDDGAVMVKVNNGNVELSGIVGSAAEKELAANLSRVVGVNSVSTEELKVEMWARDKELRKTKYASRSDQEIRDALRDAFIYDPRVRSFNPDISVKDGVVTLSGKVDNLKARQAAGEDARNIVGVYHVNNNLKVRPAFIPEDNDLESTIETALARDPVVEKWEISSIADNGVVYLNGTVDSYYEKIQAEDIAARTKGVIEVENNLKVLDENDVHFYNYYGWNSYFPPYEVDVDDYYADDAEIENEIENQLWWSPYVNEDDIEVDVTNGRAILRGTADTRREKMYAEINALEAGAEKVDNLIIVEQQ